MRVEANGGLPPALLHDSNEEIADASAAQTAGNHGWTRSTVRTHGVRPGDNGASERHGQATADGGPDALALGLNGEEETSPTSVCLESGLEIICGGAQALAGAALGFGLSWTGVGGAAGAAVAVDGVQRLVHGIENCASGERTEGYISQGLQAVGVEPGTANRADVAVNLAGSLTGGAGVATILLKSPSAALKTLGAVDFAHRIDAVGHGADYVSSSEPSATYTTQLFETLGMSELGARYADVSVGVVTGAVALWTVVGPARAQPSADQPESSVQAPQVGSGPLEVSGKSMSVQGAALQAERQAPPSSPIVAMTPPDDSKSSGAALLAQFKRSFEIVSADSPALLEEVFRLRYQIYCVECAVPGFREADFPDGLERDIYDRRSVHSLLLHRPSGSWAGTVRLVLADPLDPEARFPIEVVAGEKLERSAGLRRNTAEISRFMLSHRFRLETHQGLMSGPPSVPPILGLLRAFVTMSARHSVRTWYAGMEPRLNARVGQFGFALDPVSPIIDYYGPCRAYLSNVSSVLERVRERHPEVWYLVTDGGATLTAERSNSQSTP